MRHGPAGVPAADRALPRPAAAGAGGKARAGSARDFVRGGIAGEPGAADRLERLRAKWLPVRVKKTRQNKNLEPSSDSTITGKALGDAGDDNSSNNGKQLPRTAETCRDAASGFVVQRLPRGRVP